MQEDRLPLIEIRGSPMERGRHQGEGARAQILLALTRYCEVIPKAIDLSWEAAQRQARKFLPYAEEAFPQFVAELRGIAAGAQVPFEEVWTLNCYEGLTDVRHQIWGCTTLVVCQS